MARVISKKTDSEWFAYCIIRAFIIPLQNLTQTKELFSEPNPNHFVDVHLRTPNRTIHAGQSNTSIYWFQWFNDFPVDMSLDRPQTAQSDHIEDTKRDSLPKLSRPQSSAPEVIIILMPISPFVAPPPLNWLRDTHCFPGNSCPEYTFLQYQK